jgi:hypothetical protein
MAALARPLPTTALSDTGADLELRLDRLLRVTGASPAEPTGVAGPEALEMMCALARRGFDRVEAARRRTCGCADQACALLIVSGSTTDAIAATAQAVAGMLRPGGRMAVMAHAVQGAQERRRLAGRLSECGWQCRGDGLDSPILIATKPGH